MTSHQFFNSGNAIRRKKSNVQVVGMSLQVPKDTHACARPSRIRKDLQQTFWAHLPHVSRIPVHGAHQAIVREDILTLLSAISDSIKRQVRSTSRVRVVANEALRMVPLVQVVPDISVQPRLVRDVGWEEASTLP